MALHVWVVADRPVAHGLEVLLRADPTAALASASVHIVEDLQAVDDLHETSDPEVPNRDVLVVYATATAAPGHRRRSQRAGCDYASRMRRRGCRAPIVLLSFEHGEIYQPEEIEDGTPGSRACLRLGQSDQPWFVLQYDQCLRLPLMWLR